MEQRSTSFELLAHFDRPKTADMPDFEGVDDALSNEPSAIRIDYFDPTQPPSEERAEGLSVTKRGVSWVLQWAAAMAVLGIAAGALIEFACLAAAEHKLAIAARAGVLEATLPRATYQSVTAAALRRLTDYPQLTKQLHVSLMQNGSLVQQQFHQNDGDRFAVMLWAPNSAVMPDWLRALSFWRSDSRIQSHAEIQSPGRKLPPPSALGAGLPTPPMR